MKRYPEGNAHPQHLTISLLTPNDVQRTGPNTIDELVYSQSYNIMEIKDGYSICNYNDY